MQKAVSSFLTHVVMAGNTLLLLGLATSLWGISTAFAIPATFFAVGWSGYGYYVHWKNRQAWRAYILTLSHRVKRAASEVIGELPIGIVLYDEDRKIEWHNRWLAHITQRDSLQGVFIHELFPEMKLQKLRETTYRLDAHEKILRLLHRAEDRLLFVFDITDYAALQQKYEDDRLALGLLVIDNIDEVTQGMDDQTKSMTMAKVTTVINEYASKHHVYIRRTASDRYVFLLSHKDLVRLEKSRFDVLDEVKEATAHLKLPITISLGIAAGYDDLIALGAVAQTGLDIALSRGGDQVAVKNHDRITFYGGRSNAVEKRTKVRARVISHALRDLIRESDQVIVMGHRQPDMDSIGAAIGILRASQALGIEAHLILEGSNPAIERLLEVVAQDKTMSQRFISTMLGLERMTMRSLVVVVDTHKSTMLAEPKFLQLSKRTVIIDHHRRGEDFIGEATLVYMEPYASSASELVAELLPYMTENMDVGKIEATALLAGIVTDTNSFSVRTGSRTYEAAAYLRRNGADSALIQHMLKDQLADYLLKADMIRNTQLVYERYAVTASNSGVRYSQLMIAQVADTLLAMRGIVASFVVSERTDGLIHVSARSLGEVNVQLMMEQMGGGGHLTNAAVQCEGTIQDVLQRVLAHIHHYEKREEAQ
jgi:c-di-AMP phosphodiesterase-like protein